MKKANKNILQILSNYSISSKKNKFFILIVY